MERILVIGSPGAGKSTLSAELARRTGLPLIHLDRHHWQAGWVEPDKAHWEARVAALIGGPRWVMDGNYGGTLSLRLTRADTVIDLDFPLWLCLARIVRRWLRHRGRVRGDMADGCPEQLPFEFLAYTATFPRRGRRRIEAKLRGFPGQVVRLRSPSEVRRFLAGLA
ncbi:MAG TPA: topology modulation protein [Allosphingosinicella sp.]|jgi:adenylate kinase family enzyme